MKKRYVLLTVFLFTVLSFPWKTSLLAQVPFVTVIQPNGGENWSAGTRHLISWTDNFSHPVKIFLSNDGGSSYSLIPGADSVSGSTFSWSIPAGITVGHNYKIKIESFSGAYSDESDLPFTISDKAANAFIHVEQPSVSGISWARGTTHFISWTGNLSGETYDVYLVHYTATHAFDYAHLIASDISGAAYSWTVPDTTTLDGNYKIKVTGHVHSGVFDESDHYFSVTDVPAGASIQLLQPNAAGISWLKGTQHLISWSGGLQNETYDVYLVHYTASGVFDYARLIAGDVSGSTYAWTVPDTTTTGQKYKIRVTGHVHKNVQAESENYIGLTDAPGNLAVQVIQPNGGESWAQGTTHLISWTGNLSAETYDVYLVHYTASGVLDYARLIAGDVSGSTHAWTVPDTTTVGQKYKIRVTGHVHTAIQAESENYFSVTGMPSGAAISLIQPDLDGISWAHNTQHLISWSGGFQNETYDVYLVHYTASDSLDYAHRLASGVSGNTYSWTIPDTIPIDSTYKIRVTGHVHTSVQAESHHYFSITDIPAGTFLTIIQPKAYDTLLIGSQHLIAWNTNYHGTFKLYLVDVSSVTTPGAKPWVSYLGSTKGTTFGWTVPDTVRTSDGYAICISNSDSTLVRQSGFFLVRKVKGTITVVSPNGGEKWAAGSTHLVTWKSNVHGKFNIGLLRPGGGSDLTAIATNVSGNSYAWTLPDIQADMEVVVSSVDNPNIFDLSDSCFHILLYPPGSFIRVIQPDGGEKWQIGSSHLISWNTNLQGPVAVQLIKADDPTFVCTLADSVTGTTWGWKIESTWHGIPISPDSNYKIKIVDKKFGILTGESDTCFTLLAATTINIYPNPVAKQLTVKFNEKDNDTYRLTLYNRYNMRILQKPVNTSVTKQVRINTFNLPNGIYFLRLVSDKGVISRKIVVQH